MSEVWTCSGGAAVEYIKITELKPLSRNTRNHPESQIEALAHSIRDFGFINPIIINADKEILVGNGRFEAAKRLGLDAVPAIMVTSLTPEQERAFAIIENKLTEDATWNYELLNSEIEAIGLDMSKYGFENFLDSAADGSESGRADIKAKNEELSLDLFGDEEFKFTCDACGFRFNI